MNSKERRRRIEEDLKNMENWYNQSWNRSLLVATFNFGMRALELMFQMDFISKEGGVELFLNQHWQELTTFFLLRVLPSVLGLLLLFAVLCKNRGGCLGWCVGELFVITSYLILIVTVGRPKVMGGWDTEWMMYGYCILRMISILVVYDFIQYLEFHEEQAEKYAQIILRNHFWHQLSLYQMEKELTAAADAAMRIKGSAKEEKID